MNPEWLRYYIAAKLNANVEDIDFNPEDFVARVNSDLVGKYVNIASRTAGFISKRFGGQLGSGPFDSRAAATQRARSVRTRIAAHYEQREFGKAMREIMECRGPRQRLHRATGAVGAGEGSAERCKAASRCARSA